jgi:hypothetical protein
MFLRLRAAPTMINRKCVGASLARDLNLRCESRGIDDSDTSHIPVTKLRKFNSQSER